MKSRKNIYEDLKIRDYKDEDELVKHFLERLDSIQNDLNDFNECVAIYGKSDFVYSMFQKIIEINHCKIGTLNIRCGDFDEHESVFCVRVYDDNVLVIEDAYDKEDKPYGLDGVAFINENECEQDLIDMALKCKADVILFGFESDEPSEDKWDVDVFEDDDGEIHGFFASHESKNRTSTLSYVSDRAMKKKAVEDMLNEFYNF